MGEFSDALRRDFQAKRTRGTRGAKLARVFAKPEQLSRTGDGGDITIVINPPNEDALTRATREAKEARKLADEARART